MLSQSDRLPTIETSRLRLRWLTPLDVSALFAIFGDPDVCRYWSRPPLPDLAAAAALQQEITDGFAERTLFQWGITEHSSDEVIGTCTLASLSSQHLRAEVGFAFARRVWGRGYVGEVLAALLEFGFTQLGLHRLEADVDPRNTRSIRALERAGFIREGHQRERYYLWNEWQDAYLYGLLHVEWAARTMQTS